MCSARAHPPSRVQLLEYHGESLDVMPFVHRLCKTPIAQIQEAVDGIFTHEQAEKLKIIHRHLDSLEKHKAELESLILEFAQNYLPQIELFLMVSGLHDALPRSESLPKSVPT